MSTRESISLSGTTMQMLHTMSEGNPGGLTVLMSILESEDVNGLMLILSLDDMNIRGSQIWVGFKDFAKQDMQTFIKAIKDRSQAMVDLINDPKFKGRHTAVTSGASYSRSAGVL